MRNKSLKNKILQRLKDFGAWVHKGQIETRVKEWGFLADNGNRRCRELCEDGLIEKKEEKGSVWYRYLKQEKIISVPIFTENGNVRIEQKSIFE